MKREIPPRGIASKPRRTRLRAQALHLATAVAHGDAAAASRPHARDGEDRP
jgi:hypothetical protein